MAKEGSKLIFKNDHFGLFKEWGISIDGKIAWQDMVVKCYRDSRLYKYAVDIRIKGLSQGGVDGPAKYVPEEVEVNFHGYTNIEENQQTVSEYIEALYEADNFAQMVADYLKVPYGNK